LLLVPESGRGKVWQFTLPLRWVRAALAGGATVVAGLLGVIGMGAAVFPRIENHDALVEQNLQLRARLDAAEAQVRDVSALVQRVRVYDEKLRELAQRKQLPGFGPLEPEEQAAREAWIAGVVGAPARPTEQDPALRAAQVEALSDALVDDLYALEVRLDGMADILSVATATASVYPVTPPVDDLSPTSSWGWRQSPFGHGWKFHAGLDIEGDTGDPIYAVNDGLVVFAGWYGGYGNVIDVDHGQGVVTRYGHSSRLLVEEGELVTAGQMIALLGSTGMSTGPHLHFELRVDGESVDPSEYLP
jgi:murein DD-endopeptidase MepM/ murein hydrolase activator NlpD